MARACKLVFWDLLIFLFHHMLIKINFIIIETKIQTKKHHQQQLVFTLFSTFFWRPLHEYDVKPPDVMFVAGREHKLTYDDEFKSFYDLG